MWLDVICLKLKRFIFSLIDLFDSKLLGCFFALNRANRIVQKKLDESTEGEYANDVRHKCSIEDLECELIISIQRIERIENKAMSTLLGVAVAVAVFGTATALWGKDGLLANQGQALQIAAASLLFLALLYLLGSGLLALGAYKIGKIYRPKLESRVEAENKGKEKTLLIYTIEQNNRVGIIRSNRLSASFTCLSNGLVVVLLLGIIFILAGVRF